MTPKSNLRKKKLSEEEIDKIVVDQAEESPAWGKPIRARREKEISLCLPADLIARASFLALLHRQTGVEGWLEGIIRERIQMEEAAFAKLKRDLAAKSRAS